MTRETFETRIAEDAFLEHRLYNDNLYGTPRSFINEALLDGYDVIMKPESQRRDRDQGTVPGCRLDL